MCCLYFQVNDVKRVVLISSTLAVNSFFLKQNTASHVPKWTGVQMCALPISSRRRHTRSERHTSELQSLRHLVCRLLLEKKKRRGRARPEQSDRHRRTPDRAPPAWTSAPMNHAQGPGRHRAHKRWPPRRDQLQ